MLQATLPCEQCTKPGIRYSPAPAMWAHAESTSCQGVANAYASCLLQLHRPSWQDTCCLQTPLISACTAVSATALAQHGELLHLREEQAWPHLNAYPCACRYHLRADSPAQWIAGCGGCPGASCSDELAASLDCSDPDANHLSLIQQLDFAGYDGSNGWRSRCLQLACAGSCMCSR
jgi:hypothetical protein